MPWWFDSISKKLSVKADLAIYDQVLGSARVQLSRTGKKWISVIVVIIPVFPDPVTYIQISVLRKKSTQALAVTYTCMHTHTCMSVQAKHTHAFTHTCVHTHTHTHYDSYTRSTKKYTQVYIIASCISLSLVCLGHLLCTKYRANTHTR